MVDSPAQIVCEVCGEQNTFDNTSPKGVFSYSPCKECSFPLLYRNTNPNQHALNKRTFEKYAEAALLWGASLQAESQRLQSRNHELQKENQRLQIKARELESQISLPASEHSLSAAAEQTIDHLLGNSKYMQQVEQYIQDIGDRLSALEHKMPAETIEAILISCQQLQQTEQIAKSTDDRLSALESQLSSGRPVSKVGNKPSTVLKNLDLDGLCAIQQQIHQAVWLISYNKQPGIFGTRHEVTRAGATQNTVDLSRLGKAVEPVFGTGSGGYWLMSASQKNTAFLLPYREDTPLDQQIISYLSIAFHLTHYSLEKLAALKYFSWKDHKFTLNGAAISHMKLLIPAVATNLDGDGLWRLKHKGIIQLPFQS